jgi:sugar O-acyltransferase (sialic acid O-acetyltransferase NeuD family)
MTRRPLVITGAGGFARETAEIVRAINTVRPRWNLLGHLDDDPMLWGTQVGGLPVLGGTDWLSIHDAMTVVCIGSPRNFAARTEVVARLALPDDRYATLVHPTASIAASTAIGCGSVVAAACVTTADVTIGQHVAVMPHCVFTHDDVIGSYVTCGAGVRLAGGVTVGDGAYLGSGTLVREYLTVGRRSLIGMGSVITRDVPDHEVWVGAPAAFLRSLGPTHLCPEAIARSMQ